MCKTLWFVWASTWSPKINSQLLYPFRLPRLRDWSKRFFSFADPTCNCRIAESPFVTLFGYRVAKYWQYSAMRCVAAFTSTTTAAWTLTEVLNFSCFPKLKRSWFPKTELFFPHLIHIKHVMVNEFFFFLKKSLCLVKCVLASYVHTYFISSNRCLQYNLPGYFYWHIFTMVFKGGESSFPQWPAALWWSPTALPPWQHDVHSPDVPLRQAWVCQGH